MDRNIGFTLLFIPQAAQVALRKESVDRNAASGCVPSANGASLSARRAWIEISGRWPSAALARSRSPQGERG